MALWYGVFLGICGVIIAWGWRINRRPDGVTAEWLQHYYKGADRRL